MEWSMWEDWLEYWDSRQTFISEWFTGAEYDKEYKSYGL